MSLEVLQRPLLIIISLIAILNFLLLIRVLLHRNNLKEDSGRPTDIVNEEITLVVNNEEIIESEIHPIIIDGEVDSSLLKSSSDKLIHSEISPLLGNENPDQCTHCQIFKDLNSIVCPNCGRALNIKQRIELETS